MKINLFYILVGIAVIAGGWGAYHIYFKPGLTPSATALTAIAETSAIPSVTISSSTPAPSSSAEAIAVNTETSIPVAPQTKNTVAASATISLSAPTAPTGLSAISTTDTNVVLSWGASYDASGVTGYKIFMNGKELGTVASQKFEVPKLQPSTTYTFIVSAYNQQGQTSASSTSITVTTLAPQPKTASSTSTIATTTPLNTDVTPPSTPTGLTATAVSTSEIDLSWTAATDNVGVAGYKIISNGTFIATAVGTTYKSTDLTASTAYTFMVAAYDASGNVGSQSTSANATTQAPPTTQTTPAGDTTPPTTSVISPNSNAAIGGIITVSAIANDNVSVTKVELYVDGTLKSVDAAAPYTFTLDTVVLPDGTHSLTTKAYDAAGNVGTSSAVSITTNNSTTTTVSTTPATPTNLSAVAVSSSAITLTWSAPASTTSATGYRIFRNGDPLALSATTTYNDTGLASGTTYSYTVMAYAGSVLNASAQSASTSATTGN
jgi:chitodextrinase